MDDRKTDDKRYFVIAENNIQNLTYSAHKTVYKAKSINDLLPLITNNPNMLVYKRIDGYLADYFAGVTVIKEKGYKDKIVIHPMPVYEDYVNFMFSKKSVSQPTLDNFNAALISIKNNVEYPRIVDKYIN